MVLEFIFKLISEAQERQRLAEEERAAAAGIPMAMAIHGEQKKKKRKKKKRQDAESADAAPPAARPSAPTVEEMLPTLPTVQEAEAAERDLQRLFVLSEVLGPPLALRDDQPL